MDPFEILEALKAIIIEHGLPRKDLALFGVLCPLCGKTDRVRELETLEELIRIMGSENKQIQIYKYCWEELIKPPFRLGVCKFCNTPLKIDMEEMKTSWLIEP